MGKKTGQICWREKHSVSDLELSSLAGFFAFIWSNLCTRNIQKKITSRGHHDWPDKRLIVRSAGYPLRVCCRPLGESSIRFPHEMLIHTWPRPTSRIGGCELRWGWERYLGYRKVPLAIRADSTSTITELARRCRAAFGRFFVMA